MSFDIANEVLLRTFGVADEIDAFNAELTDAEERERARLGSKLSRQHCRWFYSGRLAHSMVEMKRRAVARRGKGPSMKKLLPAPFEPAIPGKARDDVDRLKMLWLRAHDLDQAAETYEVVFAVERGGGWALAVVGPGGRREVLRKGRCATSLLREEVEKLSRALTLRARSDLACLQLCDIHFEPFDAPGEGVVEPVAGREDPDHEYFIVRFTEKKDYRSGRGPHPEVTPELRHARRWRTRERAARDEAALLTAPGAFAVVPARKGVDYVYPPVGEETATVALSASIVAVP